MVDHVNLRDNEIKMIVKQRVKKTTRIMKKKVKIVQTYSFVSRTRRVLFGPTFLSRQEKVGFLYAMKWISQFVLFVKKLFWQNALTQPIYSNICKNIMLKSIQNSLKEQSKAQVEMAAFFTGEFRSYLTVQFKQQTSRRTYISCFKVYCIGHATFLYS